MNDENKSISREGIFRVNDNDKNPHLSVDDPGDGSEAALEADEIETETDEYHGRVDGGTVAADKLPLHALHGLAEAWSITNN